MRTSTTGYRDGLTIGQLARQWEKSTDFVRRMIGEEKLTVDERGLVTNEALGNFYKEHAVELDD